MRRHLTIGGIAVAAMLTGSLVAVAVAAPAANGAPPVVAAGCQTVPTTPDPTTPTPTTPDPTTPTTTAPTPTATPDPAPIGTAALPASPSPEPGSPEPSSPVPAPTGAVALPAPALPEPGSPAPGSPEPAPTPAAPTAPAAPTSPASLPAPTGDPAGPAPVDRASALFALAGELAHSAAALARSAVDVARAAVESAGRDPAPATSAPAASTSDPAPPATSSAPAAAPGAAVHGEDRADPVVSAPTDVPHREQAPCPPDPAGQPAGYATSAATVLGWGEPNRSEDFDGPLGPDWGLYDGPGHAGNGRRTPSAVTVANGIMTITGDSKGDTEGMSWDPGQKYGRWEGRVRAPASDPSYNALLLLWPDAENWPVGGEVDFMEMSDHTRQDTDLFLHYGRSNSQLHGNLAIDATQWHDWAIEWTPTHITAFVDGRQWWRTDDTAAFPPGPLHLCVQLDWFPHGGSAQSSRMEVDWVRQYPLNVQPS